MTYLPSIDRGLPLSLLTFKIVHHDSCFREQNWSRNESRQAWFFLNHTKIITSQIDYININIKRNWKFFTCRKVLLFSHISRPFRKHSVNWMTELHPVQPFARGGGASSCMKVLQYISYMFEMSVIYFIYPKISLTFPYRFLSVCMNTIDIALVEVVLRHVKK